MSKDERKDQEQRPPQQQPGGQKDAADAGKGSSEAILQALSMFLGNAAQPRSGGAAPPTAEAIAAAQAFASIQAGLEFAQPAASAAVPAPAAAAPAPPAPPAGKPPAQAALEAAPQA
jgi:hypothetical protein